MDTSRKRASGTQDALFWPGTHKWSKGAKGFAKESDVWLSTWETMSSFHQDYAVRAQGLYAEPLDEPEQLAGHQEAFREADETATSELLLERLKTMLALERRENARLLQENERQTHRYDRLLDSMESLRRSYDEVAKDLHQLTLVHRACECQTELQHRFDRLVKTWKERTAHLSNITKKCTHPAYQEIVGMGEVAVPLILRDLKETQADWFWALTAITGQNPIRPEDAGDIQKMTEAWLQWGLAKGYDI